MIPKLTATTILAAIVFLTVAVGLVWIGFQIQSCQSDDDERPPVELSEKDVLKDLPEPEIPLLERPFRRSINPSRHGVAPDAAEADVDSFVAAARDSTLPRRLIETRGRHLKDGTLELWIPYSDGDLVRRDFPDCDDPCEWGSRDTLIYAHTDRAFLGLPDFLRDAAVCTGFAAAGYGIGLVAKYERPELAAAGAGAGCVLIQLTN